ncbi:MAG: hypothetical protein IJJ01_07060 [Firmicutes bacterium]|nr:hypothetical protein [Bacillota bacterium]
MAEHQQSDFREQISAIPAQRMKSLQILTSFNNIAYPGKKNNTYSGAVFFIQKAPEISLRSLLLFT